MELNKLSEEVIHLAKEKILGISVATLVVFGGILSTALFYGWKWKVQTAKELELLTQNLMVQSQQGVLLKLIHEKMPEASALDKAKLAWTIYNLAQVKEIPLNIVCGVIEVESGWQAEIVSEAGATGLMQIMPNYGRPYLRESNVFSAKNMLMDPVVNTTVGISMLSDLQDFYIEKKFSKKDDFNFALHSYNAGQSVTLKLIGKNDHHGDSYHYSNAVLAAAKKYKQQGL